MDTYSPSSKGKAAALSLEPPSSPVRSKSPTMPPPSPPSPRRPTASRAHTAVSTGTTLSVPSTPFYTPQVSSVNVALYARRLLVPTVRPPRSTPTSPRIPPVSRGPPTKLGRPRNGSLSFPTEAPERCAVGASEWIPGGEKFEVVEEQLELEGFQIYAVEKWVVDRKRSILVLTVYTGDPKHKITVTALGLPPLLPHNEAQAAWDGAIRNLRREGARPKETDRGILMVTSLANFRSDYTIVHVPSGNFLDIREQLYTNINLLRMGLSGRSALTLEEPGDATKDRFIALYHVTDKASVRSRELFNATVLELVKVIQASLAIFGMYEFTNERNGLLCDTTCDGIQRWVAEFGEPHLHIEPTEKVADPTVIAALFSIILSTRSKLHALSYVVPKDPFLDPYGFVRALATVQLSKAHSHPHILTHPATSPLSPPGSIVSSSTAVTNPVSGPSVKYLSQDLIQSIQSQYDKARQSESYKVHRVLKNKLDDLATDLRTHVSEGSTGPAATSLSVTSDLAAFARCAVTSKDAPPSLRYLWTGRPGHAEKKRREKEPPWSDGERDDKDRDKDRDRAGDKEADSKHAREKDDRDRERDKDGIHARSGDEGERLWSGRMQRRIEAWTALGKGKKLSVDFSPLGKAFVPESPRGPSEKPSQSSIVPSVVVSRDPADEEDPLSSGQQSPVSDAPNPFMLGVGSLPIAERSASELSDYDRRVTEFNQRRPNTRPQSRIISWSDARSARGMLHEPGSKDLRIRTSPLGKVDSSSIPVDADDDGSSSEDYLDLERVHRRRLLATGADRRRSFDDAPAFAQQRILPVERMRIDVELCGQLLILRRREAHLANVAACLGALATRLAAQNARVASDHATARSALAALDVRAGELPRLEALRAEADALTQETHALRYESAQFAVEDLWHMAAQPRARVLALREKAFGTGRRLPQGVRGAHGPFNRVQWTLDGEGRLVDRLGRTESEAEEEDEGLHMSGVDVEEAEEVDAVEHVSLKPTWVLRFFNYWGGRLGLGRSQAPPAAATTAPTRQSSDASAGSQDEAKLRSSVDVANHGQSSAVGVSDEGSHSGLLQRTFTT